MHPTSTPIPICRPTSTAEAQKGIATYLFSAAMAKESLFAVLRSSTAAAAAADPGGAFPPVAFALSDVDDIHALPRDFDVARGLQRASEHLAAFAYITDPVRAASSAKATVMTPWSGISSATPSA